MLLGYRIIFLVFLALSLALRLYWFDALPGGDIDKFVHYVALLRDEPLSLSLAQDFTKLSPAFLYLWLPFARLELPPVLIVKSCAVFFDYLCAYWCWRMLRLGFSPIIAMLGIGAILFNPLLVINAAIWSQLDATYASFILMGVYFAMRAHGDQARAHDMLYAMLGFSLAFAFKLQASFIAPFLLFLLMRRTLLLRHALLFPLPYLLLYAPRFLLGLPLAAIGYHEQLMDDEIFHAYSYFAANFQNLILLDMGYSAAYWIGLFLAASLCLAAAWAGAKLRHIPLNARHILALATCSLLFVPFVLPHIMPRYYLPGNLLSVVLAFYWPLGWVLVLLTHIPLWICYGVYLWIYIPASAKQLAIPMAAAMYGYGCYLYVELKKARLSRGQSPP